MKVLLTGGSGNLGQTLVPRLLGQGDMPVILDVRAPRDLKKRAVFIEGSILDRATLTDVFRGCDCIVHIAAWRGIHEDRGEKNAYDFFDLNVHGTFEVSEAAASAGIDKIIFISTTSVYRTDTLYRRSKILAELIAEGYRKHRKMNAITLRPRGFILNPAVDLGTATGFAALDNRGVRLKPMRAGAVGRAGGPLGSVSALRSGCDTTVAPGPTAPQFLATAPGSRQSVGRRGVPCVGRRACC